MTGSGVEIEYLIGLPCFLFDGLLAFALDPNSVDEVRAPCVEYALPGRAKLKVALGSETKSLVERIIESPMSLLASSMDITIGRFEC